MPVVSRLRFFARYNVHISKAGNLKGIGLDEGRIARFHIADDRLSPVVDVDMLDPDVLVTAMPEPAEGFDLRRIGSQQSGRRGRKCRHTRFAAATTSEPGQYGNRRRVRASHLDRERSFNFVLRLGSFD